jgi:hypothetical protein
MLPQPAIDLLKEHCDVEINPDDRVLSRGELLEKVKRRDAVLSGDARRGPADTGQ